MAKSMAVFALGHILIALVLTFGAELWHPSIWVVSDDSSNHLYSLKGAIWTWIVFFVTLHLGRLAWELQS